MAPHSSALAWKIPGTEEPGGLQSMGSRRVRHDWATSFHFSLSCIGEGNGSPLQCFCLENPRDGGAWWDVIYGVTQSQTWLKRLSSSSSIYVIKTAYFFFLPHSALVVPGNFTVRASGVEGLWIFKARERVCGVTQTLFLAQHSPPGVGLIQPPAQSRFCPSQSTADDQLRFEWPGQEEFSQLPCFPAFPFPFLIGEWR